MSSSLPPLRHSLLEDPEKEEEEELRTLSSSPSSTTLASKMHGSHREDIGHSSFSRSPIQGARHAAAIDQDADDEFSIDIAFVPTKTAKRGSDKAAFAPLGTSSSAHFSNSARRQGTETPGVAVGAAHRAAAEAPQKLTSLAGKWDSGEVETLGKYKGSDLLDDTDGPSDEAEYQAWQERETKRRRDLLA